MITMSLREQVSLLVFLLVILAICGLEIVVLVRGILHRVHRRPGRSVLLTKPAIVLHVLVIILFACLLYGYFIEPRWIDVHAMTLHTTKLRGAGFRIVQISDLHCDRTVLNEERAVQIINSLKPDIVVATGDYLNDVSALPRLQSMLSRLNAPLGKFAVKGNFELRDQFHLDLLKGTGFRLLEQEKVDAAKGDDRITIWGLGFDRAGACLDLLQGLPDDRFDVFLHHTPDLIEDVNVLGVDLYLCGHTHGGQVALPLYGALVTFSKFGKKYESGMYRSGDTILYVNRGLGLEPRPAPQARFFARPEIAVFDILPEQ